MIFHFLLKQNNCLSKYKLQLNELITHKPELLKMFLSPVKFQLNQLEYHYQFHYTQNKSHKL